MSDIDRGIVSDIDSGIVSDIDSGIVRDVDSGIMNDRQWHCERYRQCTVSDRQ